jgi:hypothetical protein
MRSGMGSSERERSDVARKPRSVSGPETRLLVRKRTAELLSAGMEARRASHQAVAEFNKGFLSPGCCVDGEDERSKPGDPS